MSARDGTRILVPVVGGDISADTDARARRALATPGARLAIVHVTVPGEAPAMHLADGATPRWRRLADDAGAFVDAVEGSPASVVASQARRFGSDVVVADRPVRGDEGTTYNAKPRARARREMTAC